MLKEWVRNLSLDHLRGIVADKSACHHAVWRLAYAELDRRRLARIAFNRAQLALVPDGGGLPRANAARA